MAKAVEIRPHPRPPVEDTQRRLDTTPLQHADAVFNAYRTLQTMHDTKTLDFIRGLLGAGDEVLTQVTSVITTPQSMQAIRNLLVLIDLAGRVSPDALHMVANTILPIVSQQASEPPSLFAITKRVFSKDSRRALGTGVAILEAIGRSLDTGSDGKRSS